MTQDKTEFVPPEKDAKIESDSDFEDAVSELEGAVSELEDNTEDMDPVRCLELINDAQETLGRMRVYVEGKIE